VKKEFPTLEEWLIANHITYTLRKDILVIPNFGRCFIMQDYDHIFSQDKITGNVIVNFTENVRFLIDDDINYAVFQFGYRWFYVDVREDPAKIQFHILRWVGDAPQQVHKIDYYPLGIHSGYELLNGSGLIKDWCKKAKWLGYKGIGVADRNTMAASLDIQLSATGMDMKFINGYSCTVNLGHNEKIEVIIYAQMQQGFENMLRIQKAVCVDNENTKELDYLELLNRADGNVLVIGKKYGDWLVSQLDKKDAELDSMIKAFDGWVYFQVDVTEYKADRIDSEVLFSQKAYFDHYYKGGLDYKKDVRPVLINDAYYIDQQDWKNKIILNKTDTGAAHEQSDKQYLKTIDELYNEWRSVFSAKYSDEVFEDMCLSTVDIIEGETAKYDLSDNYMPKYDMTDEEKRKYGTKLNMYLSLLKEGFAEHVPEGQEKIYKERIDYETYVILSTDNLDYMLVTWDEVNWARRHGLLVGVGRGSAGGALTLFLLGITLIDPIKYGLIFERFLLPERAGLAPCKTTKLVDDIDSTDYIELTMDNGKTYKFDRDAKFLVERNGIEKEVYADELQEDDDIKFDNKDLLWYL
jgi:DNA polymerase-3 subunit alpha